uniref:CD44 antigen n=1 Tax=Rhinolophus ferrumequinum TaxID=59479 RepID=A0A671E669_RHIFE
MDKFWWRAVWGLCLVQLSLAQIELNVTCRYAGVFHVEKNGRYSISRTEAADLCKAFNCTLPTMAQMEKALKAGFETCRYGFIEGHVVIPRIHPNSICGANTTSSPMRKPQIPEWLIILASLLALALILAVCIAVNSRRRCGQKKKLVINNGNGAVEERKPSGLNGEASKSQEMVHLVNKEPSETPDQCMTADETRNLQNVDMKIGV